MKKLVGLLQGLVSTMTDAHDKLYLERDAFVRTITISNLGVKTTQFTLPLSTVQALYESGRAAAEGFLKTWDFEAYTATFRSGAPQPTRRQAITERMTGPRAGGGPTAS